MCTSISKAVVDDGLDFFLWDSMSFSDPSLPFGDILSAGRVREWFAGNDALFGSGENNVWNTGLTLWSFLGQVLQDGKQRSCNAAVTHATRCRLDWSTALSRRERIRVIIAGPARN
jgi:hypothetical protein